MPYKRNRVLDGPQIPGLLTVFDRFGPCDFVRVDIEDWEQYKNRRIFKLGSAGYAGIYMNRNAVYLHRVLLGQPPRSEFDCDHINRDPLDNRRANLRLVSKSDNQINRGGKYEKCWARQQAQNELWEAA